MAFSLPLQMRFNSQISLQQESDNDFLRQENIKYSRLFCLHEVTFNTQK